MQKYECHKVVEAAEIASCLDSHDPDVHRVAVKEQPGLLELTVIDVPAGFFARGMPKIGDYLVKYEDGYLSWSPKRTFEDGYRPLAA